MKIQKIHKIYRRNMNAAKSSHPTIQLKMMRYKKETDTASATRLKIKRRKKKLL